MKKILLFITSFLIAFISYAYDNDTSLHFYYRLIPTKATVYYKADSNYTGMLTLISDSIITLLPISSDSGYALPFIIPITDIQRVKFKRHATELGFIYGAGSGFVVGGITALVIDVADGGNGNGAFTLGGIIGAAPGALVGIVIGSAFTRGVFKINGNKERAGRLGKILERRQKNLS